MKRLGVLGAGSHSSKSHGPALRTLAQREPSRVELAAVCDLDEDRARAYQRNFGFARAYADSAAMLENEKLDGLLVISPAALTESLVAGLLPKRIPLLIEKPPGRTSEAARRLRDLARECGTRHMVSFNRRYSPAFLKAREWIAESPEARRPVFVLARMLRHHRREPEFVVETGTHLVDAVLATLGAPARVSAASPGRFHWSARIAFESGALADLVIAPDSGANEETYEIHGPEYCIQIDCLNCALSIRERNAESLSWRLPAAEAFAPGARTDSPDRDGTLGEMEAFLSFLEDPAVRVPTLTDGLAALRVAEAIAAGTEIRFPAA